MSKKGKPITFRPTEVIRSWLDTGKSAGFDMSEMINMCLSREHGDGTGTTGIEELVRFKIEERQRYLTDLVSPGRK